MTTNVSHHASDVGRRAGGAVQVFGRAGWVAHGLVWLLVGLLAIPIAFGAGLGNAGTGPAAADQQGAITALAGTSWGKPILVVLGIGLFLFAAWRFAEVVLPADDDEHAKNLAKRVGYAASGIVYAILGWSAIAAVVRAGSPSGGGSGGVIERASTTLLSAPAGRWLLGALGLAIIGCGIYFMSRGVRRKFGNLDLDGASEAERKTIETTGVPGWIGRGVGIALVGGFVLWAAITANPDEAGGLDEALRRAAENPFGAVLVVIAAVGLILYGVHAIVCARHQRLTGP